MKRTNRHRVAEILFPIRQLLGAAITFLLTFFRTRGSIGFELVALKSQLALCHNRIQAMVYTVGHPNASINQAADLCDAVLVNTIGPEIDKLVAARPYYAHTTIPGGIYAGNPDPVQTFGVKATDVTSSDVSAELVYAVVKALFDNLDRFRKMHPAFAGLEPKAMVQEGLSAPLHEGAVRYFKEKGLM